MQFERVEDAQRAFEDKNNAVVPALTARHAAQDAIQAAQARTAPCLDTDWPFLQQAGTCQ